MEQNSRLIEEYYKNGDEIFGLTVGESMYPLFRSDKDVATVKRLSDIPKVNDVLLYKIPNDDKLVLHRLIKLTENGMVIRGDNCYFKETNITFDDIIGVMTSFERNGKYYDCKTSKAYKAYIIYIRLSYPIRRLLHKFKSFIKVVKSHINKTAK